MSRHKPSMLFYSAWEYMDLHLTPLPSSFKIDLAVHKKKITEVQEWLEFALSPVSPTPPPSLCSPPLPSPLSSSLSHSSFLSPYPHFWACTCFTWLKISRFTFAFTAHTCMCLLGHVCTHTHYPGHSAPYAATDGSPRLWQDSHCSCSGQGHEYLCIRVGQLHHWLWRLDQHWRYWVE